MHQHAKQGKHLLKDVFPALHADAKLWIAFPKSASKIVSINQKDLEQPHSAEEQISLLQTHKHLKYLEIEMTKQMGTVILR